MKKVAIVTGAVRGLGRAISESLAADGFAVGVHYHTSKKEADELVRKIGNDSIAFSCDLKNDLQVEKAFGAVIKKLGGVDLLVNNVGDFILKTLTKTTNSEFRNVMESSLYSTLFATRAVLPVMRRLGKGNIINIGAVGAERFTLRQHVIPYYIAKNSVYILTKALAREEAMYGIRINMISPGSMALDVFSEKDFPMGRETKYEDVISALMFLISDGAYYINGSNIEVAGAFVPGY